MPLKGFTSINVLNGYIKDCQIDTGFKVNTGEAVLSLSTGKIQPSGFPTNVVSTLTGVELDNSKNIKAVVDTSNVVRYAYKAADGKLYYKSGSNTAVLVTNDTVGDFNICFKTYAYIAFVNLTTGKINHARISGTPGTVTIYDTDITGVNINTILHGYKNDISYATGLLIVENGASKKNIQNTT